MTKQLTSNPLMIVSKQSLDAPDASYTLYQLAPNLSESADDSRCCGGYCGIQLWKKNQAVESSYVQIQSDQELPIGSQVVLHSPAFELIKIQLILWLGPIITLLMALSILPQWIVSELLTTLIAFALCASHWLLSNQYVRKKPLIQRMQLADFD